MKKKSIVSLIMTIILSSFFFVSNVRAYFTDVEEAKNEFTIKDVYDVTYKYYAIDRYDVKTELEPESVEKYFADTLVNLSEHELSGFDYDHLTVLIEDIPYNQASYIVNGDVTIEYDYYIINYDVTFKYHYVDEYDNVVQIKPDEVITYANNSVITLGTSLMSDIDYEDVEYTINGLPYTDSEYTVNDDTVIDEIYNLRRYTITYNLDGGEENTNPIIYSAATDPITLNHPTKEYYEFTGWTWDGQDEPVLDVTINPSDKENKEFTANYVRVLIPYTVVHQKMNLDGEYDDDPELRETEEFEVLPGTEVTPDIRTYDGFTSPATQTVEIDDEGIVITYKYERNKYKLDVYNEQYIVNGETYAGEYYYGTQITMTALPEDVHNMPFVKWSDEQRELTNTFVITQDMEIMPCYGVPKTIIYNVDGGYTVEEPHVAPEPKEVYEGAPLGEFPEVMKETCEIEGDGAPEDRGCSYVGIFAGWYLDPEFTTPVDEEYIVTDNTTIYARWNGIYYHYTYEGEKTFDGSIDNIINTEINLYDEENKTRDFRISFDVLYIDPSNVVAEQPTIMNAKDEQHPFSNDIAAGFVVRLNSSDVSKIIAKGNWGSTSGPNYTINTSRLPLHFEFTRVDRVLKVSYCKIDADGNCVDRVTTQTMYDESTWTPSQQSRLNVTFGCTQNANGDYIRLFKGTIANMEVKVITE